MARVGKGDLIQELVQRLGKRDVVVTPADASKIVEEMVESIVYLIDERGKVNIPGFGTFLVVKTDPRPSRNPQTGEVIQIKAKRRPKFKAAIRLQERLQEKLND